MENKDTRLSCYVTADVARAIRTLADAESVSVSDYVRQLIEGEVAGRKRDDSLLLREVLFVSTGIDALLLRHADNTLRAVALNAHQTRLRSEGLTR